MFACSYEDATNEGVALLSHICVKRYAPAPRRRGCRFSEQSSDVRGGTLEALLQRDRDSARAVMTRLSEMLAVMHAQRGPAFGKVAHVAGDEVREDRTCERVVLGRALRDLAEAAGRDSRVAAARGPLARVTRELSAAVRPRHAYGLIHGELGPDHVLVDPDGNPVLIYVEWEHVFLRIRFGEDYPVLHRAGLDENRLRFYRLATYLSLVAGPLRLLEGDFPDRAFMRSVVEAHLPHALAHLTA
ncbi:phosphotransferase [Streptomyces sp. NPDC058391]|uniref:phosphotransferase n=1 Tax=Streptomyces sp. NPDC058391 TaxID=3346476 RepID=UPI00365864CC